MAITSASDFTGEINIAQNQYTSADLTSIIARVEQNVLQSLLGDTLYKSFSDDNFGQDAGSEQRFKDLLNGKDYNDPNNDGFIISYEGIKRMLKYFIYAHYLQHQYSYNTIVGEVKGSSQNAENMSGQFVNEQAEYFRNQAIDLSYKMKDFIVDNNEFEAEATSIVDQGGNVYLVSISDTTYIYDGDLVTIGGTNYTISNVVTDTSFEISTTSGTVFTDLTLNFEKYRYLKYTEQKKTYLGGLF